eukprot:g4938.t1
MVVLDGRRSKWGILRRAASSSKTTPKRDSVQKLRKELSDLQSVVDSQSSELTTLKEKLKNQIIETEEWKQNFNYAKYKLATLIDMWVLREIEVQRSSSLGDDNCTTASSITLNKGTSKVNQLLTTIPALQQQSTQVLENKLERKAFPNSIEDPLTEF